MARARRKDVFDPESVGAYHCINRCVRHFAPSKRCTIPSGAPPIRQRLGIEQHNCTANVYPRAGCEGGQTLAIGPRLHAERRRARLVTKPSPSRGFRANRRMARGQATRLKGRSWACQFRRG
jgi:hypothetical protein